jgi:hypothetical protein
LPGQQNLRRERSNYHPVEVVIMLQQSASTHPMVAVTDLDRAKEF